MLVRASCSTLSVVSAGISMLSSSVDTLAQSVLWQHTGVMATGMTASHSVVLWAAVVKVLDLAGYTCC